ncbi:MAG: hypothetical protein AAF705_05840 [Bacteroidota bacterium]
MKKKVYLLLILAIGIAACSSPCENLRAEDEKIMEEFEALQVKGYSNDDLRYRAKLQALYLKEQNILKQARNCDFPNPVEYNYWYGKRLKYPSKLERTWLRLSKRADVRP